MLCSYEIWKEDICSCCKQKVPKLLNKCTFFNLLSLFSLFWSKSQELMAQASGHLSGCYHRGDHHHGGHFCRPEQAFIPEIQSMTNILSEPFIVTHSICTDFTDAMVLVHLTVWNSSGCRFLPHLCVYLWMASWEGEQHWHGTTETHM